MTQYLGERRLHPGGAQDLTREAPGSFCGAAFWPPQPFARGPDRSHATRNLSAIAPCDLNGDGLSSGTERRVGQ